MLNKCWMDDWMTNQMSLVYVSCQQRKKSLVLTHNRQKPHWCHWGWVNPRAVNRSQLETGQVLPLCPGGACGPLGRSALRAPRGGRRLAAQEAGFSPWLWLSPEVDTKLSLIFLELIIPPWMSQKILAALHVMAELCPLKIRMLEA